MTGQGLIGFHCNGTDKLAYAQKDPHPGKLGVDILRELKGVQNWDAVKRHVEKIIPVPNGDLLFGHGAHQAAIELRDNFPQLKYRNLPVTYQDLYAPLGGTLKPYLDGKLSHMPDAREFIRDSLHCEWAYIANLDNNRLEVMKGHQVQPSHLPGKRYGNTPNHMGYYPCAMVNSYNLNRLPDTDRFLACGSPSGD